MYSIVEKNNKIGLLDHSINKETIPTIYNNIIITDDGFITSLLEISSGIYLQGFYSDTKESEDGYVEIEPRYLEIAVNYYGVSGRRKDGGWDIYFKGKLVIEKVDQSLSYENYYSSWNHFIFSKNNKFGIFQKDKGWIIEPIYGFIEYIDFPEYTLQNLCDNCNRIIALHKIDINNEENKQNQHTDEIELATLNGNKISTVHFDKITKEYDSYYQEDDLEGKFKPNVITLTKDTKIFQLNSDFSINATRFSEIESFDKFYLAKTESQTFILDATSKILDSFAYVGKYNRWFYDAEKAIYEEGKSENDYSENSIEEIDKDYLVVGKKKENELIYSIYDLRTKRVVCPWIQTLGSLTVNFSLIADEFPFYIFRYEGKESFMYKNSELRNFDYEVGSTNNKFAFLYSKNLKSNKTEIYRLDDKVNKLSFISDEFEIVDDYFQNGSLISYDPETGEEITAQNSDYVTVIKNKENKIGFLSNSFGNLHSPIYDSIFYNTNNDFMNTKKDGSLGVIDIFNGGEIKPYYKSNFSNEIKVEQMIDVYPYLYYVENLGMRDCKNSFVDLKGNGFYFDSKEVVPFKENGKYCLAGYDLNANSKLIIQNEARFKFLQNSFIPNVFFAGTEKKFGLINFIGDTILPFEYSKIEICDYNGDNQGLVYIHKGKKMGLYDAITNKVIIAPKYDDLKVLGYVSYSNRSIIITTLNGKEGLIDSDGNIILTNEFDEVIENEIGEQLYINATKGKQTISFNYDYLMNGDNLNEKKYNFKSVDFISGEKGYIIKDETHFDVYNLNNQFFVKTVKKEELAVKNEDYQIIFRDGKYGAADLEGTILVPCEYDFAAFFSENEYMIGYQKGVKYYINIPENYTSTEW